MTIEEKMQQCRDILEKGMRGITTLEENQWFGWPEFESDLLGELHELEDLVKEK